MPGNAGVRLSRKNMLGRDALHSLEPIMDRRLCDATTTSKLRLRAGDFDRVFKRDPHDIRIVHVGWISEHL